MEKKVLIVDDEAGVRELLANVLQSYGAYKIFTAVNGEEALEMARVERPDLVLMDVRMPLLDGNATCRMIKNDPATGDARVVMLTGHPRAGVLQEAVDAGADALVTKPFSKTDLLRAVEGVFADPLSKVA